MSGQNASVAGQSGREECSWCLKREGRNVRGGKCPGGNVRHSNDRTKVCSIDFISIANTATRRRDASDNDILQVSEQSQMDPRDALPHAHRALHLV